MEPLYTPANTTAAYQLNWGLALFWRATAVGASTWLRALSIATEPDGVRILKHEDRDDRMSVLLLSTKPPVSPERLLRSVKGRLQYLVREKAPRAFHRNYSLRSIGSGDREAIEGYIAGQLGHHPMADDRVQRRLHSHEAQYPKADLSAPRASAHGQYWFNLHVVLVNEGRWMEIRDDVLAGLGRAVESTAAKHRHTLSRRAILPDHIHLAMGCPEDQSPEEIALSYMNNCAHSCGMKPVLKHSYYVGTFGEYDLGAV
jgi:REP element-mobilizing transposase RayT